MVLNKNFYTTFSKFIEESKKFKTKPEHFEQLTQIIVEGKYQNDDKLQKVVDQVFIEFENILDGLGFDLIMIMLILTNQ